MAVDATSDGEMPHQRTNQQPAISLRAPFRQRLPAIRLNRLIFLSLSLDGTDLESHEELAGRTAAAARKPACGWESGQEDE